MPPKSDVYTNLSGHPITLDDGSIVASGEDTNPNTSLEGPLAQSALDSGHLILKIKKPTGDA